MHTKQSDSGWRGHRHDKTPYRERKPRVQGGYGRLTCEIQVYPVAYLEFFQGEDGKRKRIGPMGEEEEMAARDAWQVGDLPCLPKNL